MKALFTEEIIQYAKKAALNDDSMICICLPVERASRRIQEYSLIIDTVRYKTLMILCDCLEIEEYDDNYYITTNGSFEGTKIHKDHIVPAVYIWGQRTLHKIYEYSYKDDTRSKHDLWDNTIDEVFK